MFGFRNFTGVSFVGKVGKFGLEFSAGILEEVTLNMTSSAAAHAAEIPIDIKDINVEFISKDKFITTTSAVVSSKIVQTKLIDVIVGATPNLLI